MDTTRQYAVGADLVTYLIQAAWRAGAAEPYDDIASPATFSATLDNRSGAFNPDDPGATFHDQLRQGTLMRIRYGGTYFYLGKIIDVIPRVGEARTDKVVTLTAECPMRKLLGSEFAPKLLLNARVDTGLRQPFDQGVIVWPYEAFYFMIGVVGAAELGVHTRLLGGAPILFEQALTTLPFIGDNLGRDAESLTVQGYIRDLNSAEPGFWFWNPRAARFEWWNRRHFTNNRTVAATFTGDDLLIDPADFRKDPVVNSVKVFYQPIEVGSPGTTVYRAPGLPITLQPGQERTIRASYSVDSAPDATVGAMDWIDPIHETDYEMYQNADGTGTDRSVLLSIHVNWFADHAEITLKNQHPNVSYVTTLQLRATPLIRHQRESVESINGASIFRTIRSDMEVQANAVSNTTHAQSLADVYTSRFAVESYRFRRVGVKLDPANADLFARALPREIGDRITISVSSIGHVRDYYIVGEEHLLTAGAAMEHIVTWILRPADPYTGWVLGDPTLSRLGVNTRLNF